MQTEKRAVRGLIDFTKRFMLSVSSGAQVDVNYKPQTLPKPVDPQKKQK